MVCIRARMHACTHLFITIQFLIINNFVITIQAYLQKNLSLYALTERILHISNTD